MRKVSLKFLFVIVFAFAIISYCGILQFRQNVVKRNRALAIQNILSNGGYVDYQADLGGSPKAVRPIEPISHILLLDFDREQIRALAELPEIESLTLTGANCRVDTINEELVLPLLRELNLFGVPLSEEIISNDSLRNVKSLTLVGLSADDNTIIKLHEFESLRMLNIYRSPTFSDDGMKLLDSQRDLRTLTHLRIEETMISNESIPVILGLRKLKKLVLVKNQIDKEGLNLISLGIPSECEFYGLEKMSLSRNGE